MRGGWISAALLGAGALTLAAGPAWTQHRSTWSQQPSIMQEEPQATSNKKPKPKPKTKPKPKPGSAASPDQSTPQPASATGPDQSPQPAATTGADQSTPQPPSATGPDQSTPKPASAKTSDHSKLKPLPVESNPDLDETDQLSPSQVTQPMPAAVAEPSRGSGGPQHAPSHATNAMVEPAPAAAPSVVPKPSQPAVPKAVACNGVFGKDSNRVKLAATFAAKNVEDTEVDSASGNKVMASVLFGSDPKRRLEVWWNDQTKHSDIHLIVINGDSAWAAPGGLHLGLTLAELEKLNHRPFKLSGFDKTNVSSLIDWNGGELAYLSGGCKVGVSLRADPNASALVLSLLSAGNEFTSSDASLRAANPKVSEILVAY